MKSLFNPSLHDTYYHHPAYYSEGDRNYDNKAPCFIAVRPARESTSCSTKDPLVHVRRARDIPAPVDEPYGDQVCSNRAPPIAPIGRQADASTPWIRLLQPALISRSWWGGGVYRRARGRPCGVALQRAWPAALRPAAGRRGPRTRSMVLSTAMEMVWVRKVDLNHSAVRSQDVNARGGRGVTAFLLEVRPVRQHLAVEGGPWKFKASPCAGAIASHVIRSLQECMT